MNGNYNQTKFEKVYHKILGKYEIENSKVK